MKIDKRYAGLANAFLMAIILPFFMTLVVTVANMGLTEGMPSAWMRTWMIASIAAFPLILLLGPMIRKLVAKLTA